MKKGTQVLFVVVLFGFSGPLALANGLNLNSLGSKATAMGGAFVGLADDFSALFWNPAGIAQFKAKYFGFNGTDVIPSGKYRMDIIHPVAGKVNMVEAKMESKHYLVGMAGYYHPISDNLVAGFGVYVPSGLGASWDGADFSNISAGKTYEWNSKIGLVSIAPALAYKISDMFYIGGSLNINYGMFNLKMHAGEAPISAPPHKLDLGQYEESMTGWGYGVTLGVMVKPNEMFSLGAALRTSSRVKFKGEADISNMHLLKFNNKSDTERTVEWPMWLAAGVAFKPMEKLVLTADLQWTQWSRIKEMETDYKDPFWKLMMAQAGDDIRPMHWQSALQVRLGAEYKLSETLALRGGFYRDPSPAPNKTMNVLLPNYDFNAFALGVGYALDGLQIDFGLEYLKGAERNVEYVKTITDKEWAHAMPGIYNMTIIAPTISVGYKF